MKQAVDNKTGDLEDVFYWDDGVDYPTWCYRYELHEMQHMSDDYSVIYFDSDEWKAFHLKQTGV